MTDATAAPVEEPTATTVTASADTTTDDGTPSASATDAAKSAEASAPAKPGSTETDDVPELTALTKEQRKTLGEHLKKLDPDARKVFNQLLDGKLQETATERKAREAAEAKATELSSVQEIINKIESDPEGMLAQLSAKFVKRKANGQVVVSDDEVREIEASLDEASKPLAKVMAPALKAMLDARLKPIEEREQAAKEAERMSKALSAIDSFTRENPDWKQFEPAMTEVGLKLGLDNKPGMDPGEILRITYALASYKAKLKAAEKTSAEKILEKVERAAGNAEPDTTSVSPARAVRKPPATTAEAWAQAQEEIARGEITD